ncbi:MAG: hypothetical protein JOY68_02380 [Candidatus Dormibacteraeota bacterium]|nr:hypothetical protein [Candidatus Dormibacteraeota bacterium]MBV8444354.1 hypothetical protein [Candidatus Dormibacteraeota bacterium]
MWGPQIMEMWQVAEQEHMRRIEAASARRASLEAGVRRNHLPRYFRIRRDRRDGS